MRFRLVDHICEFTPWKSITATKSVSLEEYFLKDEFGDVPKLPETLLVESMLQAGNWLVVLSSDFEKMGIVVGLQRVEISRSLRPGEMVTFHLNLGSRREDAIYMEGKGYVQGEKILEGKGAMAILRPLDEFEYPPDLRILYEELGPEPPKY